MTQGGYPLTGVVFRPNRDEKGASLVEFAFVLPLLVLFLFGIIEFGWLFSQHLDVRHGAREGARLAAVNFPEGPPPNSGSRSGSNTDTLVAEICGRMQTATDATVTLSSSGGVGDAATATVTSPGETLSGALDWAFPSDFELQSSVDIRMEQSATWANTTDQDCP